jgi:hypothetical protein
MDRTVEGNLIRAAGHDFARGIGAHSYSRISFDIAAPGTFAALRTQYAIDGDLPLADVTARILLDGNIAWEKSGIRAAQVNAPLAPPVILDIAGHKTLTLEVDFGENYDVQDRFNWIEPALLRQRPTTAPSTQP